MSTWDAATSGVNGAENVLIFDEEGSHNAISLAQYLAGKGKGVTIATADRMIGRNLGGSSYPVYLAALAKANVGIITDHHLATIEPKGNRMRVVLSHAYGASVREIVVDRVIAELGTQPADQLFHDLKAQSRNRGVTDIKALKAGMAQPWLEDGQSGMLLFRVGDAVASRDVHSAMLDSLRLLKDV